MYTHRPPPRGQLGQPAVRSTRGLPALTATCLLLLLAACGGGGGDSASSDSTPTPSVPPVTTAPVTTDPVTPPVAADPQVGALAAALRTGNSKDVTLATAQAAMLSELKTVMTAYAAVRQTIYGLNADGSANANSVGAIEWQPYRFSAVFNFLDQSRNHAFLTSNWRYSDNTPSAGKALGVAGVAPETGARYVAIGANPLSSPGNAAMDSVMRNTIVWLTGRGNLDKLKIVTAHLPGDQSGGANEEPRVRSWLANQIQGVTINGVATTAATVGKDTKDDTCDGDKLDACLKSADLLILGRKQGPNVSGPDNFPAAYNADTVMNAVLAAQARGIPVMYLHQTESNNGLSARLMDYFGLDLTANYWTYDGLKTLASASQPVAPANLSDWMKLMQRVEKPASFTTDWSGCVDDVGRLYCERYGSRPGDAALINEFTGPGQKLRDQLRALDTKGVAIFSQPGYGLEKRLVVLGDKYREQVSYPMTRLANREAFFQAYFSDFTAYINRPTNAVARNLGNFSAVFPSDMPTISRLVTTSSQESGNREYMTGLYAMPGRTVTLTRTDTGTQSVTVGLNMLRDTTHVYQTYDRPTLLSSPRLSLLPGKSVTLTSPFGGPVYLFVASATGAPSVTVQVDGVITHPVLRNPNDAAQVATFKAELASTPTNWVGIATDFLTVHATVPSIKGTLSKYGDSLPNLAADIWTYMIKDTYELAGFNAANPETFKLSPTVSAYCKAQGWDCTGPQHRRESMQHAIFDNYSLCGGACAGNPFDKSWSLDPLGWGETHEIGHNLQRGHLNIYGGQSTEVSNNIFPLHKLTSYNKNAAPAKPLIHKGYLPTALGMMKDSLATNDPVNSMKTALWGDTGYAANSEPRLEFYRQMVEFNRHYHGDVFSDGWELYTLLYLLDRNFVLAKSNWASNAASLGFGTYATYPDNIDGNDFLLVGMSRIIGRDMRPVFDMWGITYTQAAVDQVVAYKLPAAERLMFPMASMQQYGAGIGAPIQVNAQTVYPAGY
ncbi:MAG: hypothetical protein CFE46_09795 [Burkholderiales bacterium PBB6]|nr:MAG: hypothetical protein CFE46_09795 [Burkholderiales bacterium PBB6]